MVFCQFCQEEMILILSRFEVLIAVNMRSTIFLDVVVLTASIFRVEE
jgi:hypothetical protein